PGDPRCCPSGETTFSISLSGAGKTPQRPVQPMSTQPWSATPSGSGRVTIEGLAADGRSRFIGACAASGGEPGFRAEFQLDGALMKQPQQPELLQLEVNSRSWSRSFTVNTLYDPSHKSRI